MAAEDRRYTFRTKAPEHFERSRSNTAKMPAYYNGAITAPTSGTVTFTKPDGTVVVSAAVVTINAESIAEYTLTSIVLGALEYGEGYVLEWALLMGDGIVHTPRRNVVVGRREIYPPATDADLLARHSDLAELRSVTQESFQGYIDEAWVEILDLLRQKGTLPHLIASSEDLRFPLVFKTFELIFTDWETSGSGAESRWGPLAARYGERFTKDWAGRSFKYDSAETGKTDQERRPATPVTFLASSGDW